MGVYVGLTVCPVEPTYKGVLEGPGNYTHMRTGDAKLKNYIFILLLYVPMATEYKLSKGCETPTN